MLHQGFKQLLKTEICRKCRVCCRFYEAQSSWRPKLIDTEFDLFKSFPVPGPSAATIAVEDDGYLKTHPYADIHACVFLNTSDSRCQIYSQRPLECLLYPFLIYKSQRQIYVTVHLACPFVQEHHREAGYMEYVEYFKEYIQQEFVRTFLRKNLKTLQQYPDHPEVELLLVFDLESD